MSHNKQKSKAPSKKTSKQPKPKSTTAGARHHASAPQGSASKRWSLGASWDGFGVKAGLKLDSRNQPNSTTTLSGPRFKHTEVIGTLAAPGAGQASITVAHVFQPGMHTQFPWLANTAGGFQQYRVHSTSYTYEPFASVFAAGGVQGRVSLFFDYAVSSPLDENIDDMLNKAPSCNTQSACGISLRLNPNFMIDNTRKSKNLRLDDQTVSTNYDSFDAGRLVIGLDQFTTNVEFGKLICNYDVEFLIPASQKIPAAVQRSALCDHFYIGGGGLDWPASGGASGVLLHIRDGWSADAANAGNVTQQGTPGNQYFLMEEGVYMVVFTFIQPLQALNNIQSYYTALSLNGGSKVDFHSASFAPAGLPQYFNSFSANGTAVVSAGGAQGIVWPLGQVYYSALNLGMVINITFIAMT